MNEQQILQVVGLLKIDLGISTTAYDERLSSLASAAVQAITREGAALDGSSAEDIQLVVMYSEWLWNKRRTGEGMPRMLRFALNNRIFSEKMAGES